MEILGKILGNSARVKIMRMMLLNRGKRFTTTEIAKRTRVTPILVRREVRLLSSVGFLKRRDVDWSFNALFKYGSEFEDLLLSSNTLSRQEILNHFKNVGRMKLVVVSGIFIKNHDSRVDILIVGDGLKKGKIEEGVRKIEASMGAELVYATFETKDFIYRLNMYDKLIRDILDYPHEVILQAKELSTQSLKKV